MPSKYVKWFLYLVLLSIIGSSAVRLIFSLDATGKEVERYLASNKEVLTRIGSPEAFDLYKKTSVGATSELAAYKKYSFYVKGQKASANIVVRVDQPVANAQENFSIVSFEER